MAIIMGNAIFKTGVLRSTKENCCLKFEAVKAFGTYLPRVRLIPLSRR